MPQTFVVDLEAAGTLVREVSLTTGMRMWSEARSNARGHHMTVDVPAVMEILRSISDGAFTAEEVRQSLGRCVNRIDEQLNREHEEMVWRMEAPTPSREPVRRKDRRQVYAVSSEQEPKIIKIGVARDLTARLRSLQTASASPLRVRWTTQGRGGALESQDYGKDLEEGIHRVFKDRRLTGEWFDFRDVESPIVMINNAAYEVLSKLEEWDDLDL
ncbi:GIY-YIG nuclease family protein [Streptomyces sp. NPDC001436]